VIMEAVCCGTPVLASSVDGNIGMLGAGYSGYFPHGDAQSLAALLVQCRDATIFPRKLRTQCRARAPLFAPAAEKAALERLVEELLG